MYPSNFVASLRVFLFARCSSFHIPSSFMHHRLYVAAREKKRKWKRDGRRGIRPKHADIRTDIQNNRVKWSSGWGYTFKTGVRWQKGKMNESKQAGKS
ncbi:hypothetical protein K457DRAFT_293389 [Linnemannia elongata AG-77]|uniref:Uncharacterized protein n=1 Tax=Linnemannia elongata AG-77 TaxID=1314771 RepID=A0A197JC28_9FUNG|nr:hypothetical protein K457DRAFT_293389 [Linnemannia elongata AG-77]